MRAALRDALESFASSPNSAEAALIQALSAEPSWWIAMDPDGRPHAVAHARGRFLAVGSEADDVAELGRPAPIQAEALWARTAAGLEHGVVIDPAGPAPAWLDQGGVYRISGVPGLRMEPPLRPRSVAEQHLYLDLLGWPKAGRSHVVASADGELVARFRWADSPRGTPSERSFILPDPAATGWGGPTPSALIDPVGWHVLAELYAGSVAAKPGGGGQGPSLERLDKAIACLDEVLRFAQGEAIPPDAFHSASGARVYALAPERFEPARLQRVREAWQGLKADQEAP